MSRFSFTPGVTLLIDGARHRFLPRSKSGSWQLVELATSTVVSKSTQELNELYVSGRLTADPDNESIPRKEGYLTRAVPPAISDLPDKAKARIRNRQYILEQVARRTVVGTANARIFHNGNSTTPLKRALEEICGELGISPISVATYYRIQKVIVSGGKAVDLQGRHNGNRNAQLDPRVRQIVLEEMASALERASDMKIVGRAPGISMRDIRYRIERRLVAQNELNSEQKLRMPCKSTLYEYWNSFPAFQRDVAKYGKTRARMMYRACFGHEPREGLLDLVEYDETQIPLFLFDEAIQIPLGRPWLTWYLEVLTRMPIGFYVGFERPSDLTIASALRHACLPKAYVAQEYPDIQNPYLGSGLPHFITFDNGLSQHGASIRDITSNIRCPIDFTPSRMPWFKSTVEGMFKNLNKLALETLPGFVSSDLDNFDYDPAKYGCLGLRQFLRILHHWLIDTYCQRPWGYDKKSPSQRWEEAAAEWPPDLLGRATDLDAVFGIIREGTLDHRGVVFHNIRYFSEELQALRIRFGANNKVRVKINPSDLKSVLVWHAGEKVWLPAEVVPQMRGVAEGRSLHCHKLISRYASEKLGRTDVDGLRQAEWRLREMIAEASSDAMSIRSAMLAARFTGIGTQNIFGNQTIDGRLAELSGPFRGLQSNPLKPAQGPPEMSNPPIAKHANDGGDETKKRKRPKVPELRVDKSLGD